MKKMQLHRALSVTTLYTQRGVLKDSRHPETMHCGTVEENYFPYSEITSMSVLGALKRA